MTRPSEIQIGQEWSRRDPNGSVTEFEVTAIATGPLGNLLATGRTARGKLLKCQVRQMLANTERFTFIRAARVREAG